MQGDAVDARVAQVAKYAKGRSAEIVLAMREGRAPPPPKGGFDEGALAGLGGWLKPLFACASNLVRELAGSYPSIPLCALSRLLPLGWPLFHSRAFLPAVHCFPLQASICQLHPSAQVLTALLLGPEVDQRQQQPRLRLLHLPRLRFHPLPRLHRRPHLRRHRRLCPQQQQLPRLRAIAWALLPTAPHRLLLRRLCHWVALPATATAPCRVHTAHPHPHQAAPCLGCLPSSAPRHPPAARVALLRPRTRARRSAARFPLRPLPQRARPTQLAAPWQLLLPRLECTRHTVKCQAH